MTVIIGMDPHKRSATIEIIDAAGHILTAGRYATDTGGYTEILTTAQQFADRVWAVEGCNGIGRHLAHRLVHDGETVVDVPAKLSAQVRVFATGNGRKTDPVDAHSVALAALHAPNLRRVELDAELVALGLLADRRDELGRARTETLNRIHRLLLDLIPGGAKKFLSAPQARDLIADLRPCDPVGRVQLRLVIELIEEPALPRRQPQNQPRPAHHGRGPAAPPHRRPRLLRRSQSGREELDGSDARSQTPTFQHRLRANTRRPAKT
ncbi:transposase [Nocardia sp. NPDC059239]|uniref:IS110 family transposase n=1 Tax=unclassified Nocardia TaxID=2637762 RepID=UPI00369BD887